MFRLGKEILLSYLFDDDMMHIFLFSVNNIYRFNFHRQSITYELNEKKENEVLVEFFKHYKINPKNMHQGSLLVIVASLNQTAGNTPELKPKDNGNDLECQVKKQKLIFS